MPIRTIDCVAFINSTQGKVSKWKRKQKYRGHAWMKLLEEAKIRGDYNTDIFVREFECEEQPGVIAMVVSTDETILVSKILIPEKIDDNLRDMITKHMSKFDQRVVAKVIKMISTFPIVRDPEGDGWERQDTENFRFEEVDDYTFKALFGGDWQSAAI